MAQGVKDLTLSLLRLELLLWQGFRPWPRNFHMLWVQPKNNNNNNNHQSLHISLNGFSYLVFTKIRSSWLKPYHKSFGNLQISNVNKKKQSIFHYNIISVSLKQPLHFNRECILGKTMLFKASTGIFNKTANPERKK